MKYAIYKNLYGLEAWEYIDNETELKRYPYISPDSLPIIINRCGGYNTFNKNNHDELFVEIIEVETTSQILTLEQMFPINSDNFEYGWIDLYGNTYSCEVESHGLSAKYICESLWLAGGRYNSYNYESILENLGWLKVSGLWHQGKRKQRVYSGDGSRYITQSQADRLFDLGLFNEGSWEIK